MKHYRGYHSPAVRDLIANAWEKNELLILEPPQPVEWNYSCYLPGGTKAPEYPDTPVLGIFSSGTSGSKLILYSKKNIESSLKAILSLFDTSEIHTIACYPQPYHTFGLILGYCHSLLYGKKLLPLEGEYRREWHAQWLAHPDSKLLTLGTPTHFKDLIAFAENKKPRETYSSIIGAAKVERALWLSLRDILMIHSPSIGYGATEASPGITHLPPGKEPLEDGEVGEFLPHLKCELLPDEGVQFEGPSVCLAVIHANGIEFPQKILIPDHLERRKDQQLVYRGRYELFINRGGEKFYSEQIESFIREKAGVEVICVSVPDPRLGEEIGLLAKGEISPEPIYQLLNDRWGREFNRNWMTVNDFPLNGSFKVDRPECQRICQRRMLENA